MTKDRIIAEVRLHIETVRDIDVNRHISTALTQLSEIGIERKKAITIVTGAIAQDPSARTSATAFNYYPDLKCLVLPSSLISASIVKFNSTELDLSDMYAYNTNTMDSNSYIITGTNEMYLGFALADTDTLEISGMWAVRSLDLLSDMYENWILNHVLARLYSAKPYKDADQFGIYEAERQRSWRIVKNSINNIGSWMAKDGLL